MHQPSTRLRRGNGAVYIALLEGLDIPITTERGRYGAYMLVAGFKLPPMMVTDDEVLALSIGRLAAGNLGLHSNAAALASARAKLERVMPEAMKRRVRAVEATVAPDPAGTLAGHANSAALCCCAPTWQRRAWRSQLPSVYSKPSMTVYGCAHAPTTWPGSRVS